MPPIDIIIIVSAVAIVGSFVGVAIWRKKTGRSKGCGFGCDCDCSRCSACPSKKENKQ